MRTDSGWSGFLCGHGEHSLTLCRRQEVEHNACNLSSQKGWYRVANLVVLLRSIALEEIAVWKGLETSCFSDCQASTLGGIVVDVVVAVLTDVRSDRGRRRLRQLNPEAICEHSVPECQGDVLVIWV